MGTSRGENQIMVFTGDRETLLSGNSPVNRMALKPKALDDDEILSAGLQVKAANSVWAHSTECFPITACWMNG